MSSSTTLFVTPKKCFKYQFNIQVLNLKIQENLDIYFIYKRGKYRGESSIKKWKSGEIEFNQNITFNCSLFKNEKGIYKKKYFNLFLCSGKDKTLILSELKINLAEYLKETKKTFKLLINNEKVDLTLLIQSKKYLKENLKFQNLKFIDLSNDLDQGIFQKETSPRKNTEVQPVKRKNLSNFITSSSSAMGIEEEKPIFIEQLDKTGTKNKIDEQEIKLKLLQQELLMKEQESNESQIIDVIIIHQNPKYIDNIPISSCILFKSILYWKGFSSNSGYLFKVQNAIERIIQSSQQDHRFLCYWLNTCIYLLNLINFEYPFTIKKNLENEILLKINYKEGFELKYLKNEKEGFEFETPVIKFKDFLLKLIHQIYSNQLKMIYDQIYSHLLNLIEKGIQPIINILMKYLKLLKDNKYQLIDSFFNQIYYFLNSFIFTNLLNGKWNSMNNSIILKMNISQLEHFITENNLNLDILNQLILSRQSCDILIMNKSSLTDESLRREICPNLNTNQIRKLLLNYKADQYDEPVSQSIIQAIPISSEKEELDFNIIWIPNYPLDLNISKWESIEEKELSFEFVKK